MQFIEVKKQSDAVKDNQLVCLAQIRELLGCAAHIVYLREASGHRRVATRYVVTLHASAAPKVRHERRPIPDSVTRPEDECECCPEGRTTLAVDECVLCCRLVCIEHAATVVATARTICSECLRLRNEIGPYVPTIRFTAA
ncbi:hypothetical protein [Anaeromyxobacter oryzae]|uniref:Zinc finger PHD-type domain-containing protein n=1 Tax=Anaeromyxobacter oryzae TaxID=2918170 RepID=A0ABN6N1B6_9BACT|nr:hypothetical protein [Anaeromyxobacter oryzae]BDG05745.1 hypothetical protein AMOR_47410 [Anaeromyxobacter oryzae]